MRLQAPYLKSETREFCHDNQQPPEYGLRACTVVVLSRLLSERTEENHEKLVMIDGIQDEI
jgi:hypothetical protein